MKFWLFSKTAIRENLPTIEFSKFDIFTGPRVVKVFTKLDSWFFDHRSRIVIFLGRELWKSLENWILKVWSFSQDEGHENLQKIEFLSFYFRRSRVVEIFRKFNSWLWSFYFHRSSVNSIFNSIQLLNFDHLHRSTRIIKFFKKLNSWILMVLVVKIFRILNLFKIFWKSSS